MLGIKYNNIFFDLYPNTTISLELNNPVFDDDVLKGNYSFPFKIPLTPLNRQLLDFPDEPGSFVDLTIPFIIDLYVDGLLLFPRGQLNIKTVAASYADTFILLGISTFGTYANTTKIADVMTFMKELSPLEPGQAGFDPDKYSPAVAKASLTETVDTCPYIFFPVVNDGNEPDQPVDGVAATDHLTVYNLWVTFNDAFTPWENNNCMVPFFYNTYVLREVLKDFNVPENIFETDDELKTLALLNNFTLDKWIESDTTYKRHSRNIEARNHVPDLFIADYMIALKKMFCLYIYSNPFNNKLYFNTMTSILEDNNVTDWTSICFPYSELSQDPKSGIKFLPQANGDQMIGEIKSLSSETINDDIASLVPGEIHLNYANNCYYKRATGTGIGTHTDDFFTWAYGDFYIPPATYEVSTAFSGAEMVNLHVFLTIHDYPDGDYQWVPIINIPGSYLTQEKLDGSGNILTPETSVNNPNCIKLAFWRGMQLSQVRGLYYPMGDSNNHFIYPPAGSFPQTGNYSLAFDGQWGLYETWWKKYLNFRANTKLMKANVKLDLVTLLNLDMRRKIRIQGQHYFIKKITLQLPLKKPAEVEFWKA